MNETDTGVEQVTKDVEFKHPLLMNLVMFAGEVVLLFLLQISLTKNPEAAAAHQRNRAHPCLFLTPSMLDVCGSFLNFTGLALITASTFQILKMLSLVVVALLSATVLRHRYSFVQWVAVALVVTGMMIVSLQSINPET